MGFSNIFGSRRRSGSKLSLLTTRKLEDRAAELVAQRKFAKTIELYTELMVRDARQARWPHKLGEAYEQMGHNSQAAKAFLKATVLYEARDRFKQAIAVAQRAYVLWPESGAAVVLGRLHARVEAVGRAPTERGLPIMRIDSQPALTAGTLGRVQLRRVRVKRSQDASKRYKLPPALPPTSTK